MEDGHLRTSEETLKFFNADLERGLSADQVKRNQEKYGPNGMLFFNYYFILLTLYLIIKDNILQLITYIFLYISLCSFEN